MNREKEISIVELYRYVKMFFRRWWLVLLITVIVGALFGFFKSGFFSDNYNSNITISSSVISKNNLYSAFLPMMDNQGITSVKMLKPVFGDDADIINNVQEFRFDTTSMNQSIMIYFVISDTSIIKKMRKHIEVFLEARMDYQKQFEREEQLNQEYLDVLNEEIKELNQYQKQIIENFFDMTDKSGKVILSGSHAELVELYEKKMELKRQMINDEPIRVSVNMQAFPIPPNTVLHVILWAVVFAILMVIILVVIELDRASRQQ
ncbi:MAG: hypothetical protein U9Q98_01455 [Bacteroidota bacterium]|nr:hypothetical protein [Bacteroidota bacterium]